MRKMVAKAISELANVDRGELERQEAHLARTERRIKNLAAAIAEEGHSRTLLDALADEEANRRLTVGEIERIKERRSAPVRLPSDDEIIARVFDLERVLTTDINEGQRALRALFRDEKITLTLGEDGVYTATAELLPLAVLLKERPRSGVRERALSNRSCGGRI